MINLMQRTLTEIARINISVTYRYAFTYIRQLAIHLRGAITIQKKVSATNSSLIQVLCVILLTVIDDDVDFECLY
jgi:Noc2p family